MAALVWVNRTRTTWPAALEARVREAALATITAEAGHPWLAPWPQVELGVTLTGDAEVREYNRAHRGKDRPTNVLSFAMNDGAGPPSPMLGDLLLAYETVAAEADALGIPLEEHVTHLVVHGVLHLLGYDHERSPAEAARQEAREVAILATLGVDDPYRDTLP